MSRRKAFDTSLSGSSVSTAPRQTTNNRDRPPPLRKASASSTEKPATITPPDPSIGSGTVPTETSAEKAAELDGQPPPEVATNEDVCFICAEPIAFWSVGVCGHRTCHVCAVRLRIFYKKTECTFCKTPTPSVLFSRSPTTPFPTEHHVTPSPPAVIAAALAQADKLEKGERWDRGLTLPGKLDMKAFAYTDEKLGVVFEDEDMMEATLLLLRFNCPFPDCAHMAHDWVSLERHTLSTHGLVICYLCRKQLSRFAHEQVLYPPHLLPLHDPSRVARGQRPPRPKGEEIEMVKQWEAPHPMCEFCHEAFFGPDELFKHMRERHEECFVCRQLGEKDVYFQNYSKLENHFNNEHFPCQQPSCLEKKFQVFGSDMDLRAHMMSEHGETMSARERANVRQLHVDFSSSGPPGSSTSHSSGRRRDQDHGHGHGRGRGFSLSRDNNVQHQQISQAPPMAPAQAAQARRTAQVERQEEGRRRKAFETSLTGSAREEEERGSASGFATPREDVDDASASKHAQLLSKVTMLTNDNTNKLVSFRSAVRQYRNNESGAKDVIDTLFNVFDRDQEATVGVVRDVAGLFNGPGEADKSRALLEALNGFRIQQQEQFPALATPSGLGSDYAGITSGAILNAKRSTQTRRHGSQNIWDRVEAAAANHPVSRPPATTGLGGRVVPGASTSFASASGGFAASAAFPSLANTAMTAGPSRNQGPHSTPWSTGGAGSSSKSPPALTGPIIRSATQAPAVSAAKKAPASKPQNLSNSAFPALPSTSAAKAAQQERKALFTKPTPREESIRRITGGGAAAPAPATNGWGGGGGGGLGQVTNGMAGLGVSESAAAESDGDHTGQGGKKKGKGKQLLFSVSARP